MKDIAKRLTSGLLFILIFVTALLNNYATVVLLFVFGLLALKEFNRLISTKNFASYLVFTLLYVVFVLWKFFPNTFSWFEELSQILHVLTIFVLLFLMRDLFSKKSLPTLLSNRFINSTFYISSSFVFMFLIAFYYEPFNSKLLLSSFVLVWINDSFAYLIGSRFGKQKLFASISPKKTVEGFLGGLFFTMLASVFVASFLIPLLDLYWHNTNGSSSTNFEFSSWLIISVIICVCGTIGDLIESKYKREACVKDSGIIMPGHGGILDRLDSIIFAAPFIYLFVRIFSYVS